ncbi:MAG: uracil phosphoribosyltransferase [Verrucomicrobia bacterium]|nr:uracil phosphoribosyltransferase [Verrucomicrobiota bacterium]
MQVHQIRHPLILNHLSRLRDAATPSSEFRTHLQAIGRLMVYEITRDLPLVERPVTTPLEETRGWYLEKPLVIVPILRAGLGMVEGIQQLLPSAHVGHIGLARNETTLRPESYYCKLPSILPEAEVLLVDPMLATGNSSAEAARQILAEGAVSIRLVCLVSAPEGIAKFHEAHPKIPIYTAAIDRGLNERGYIVPGLGDAGDRYFGTL